MSGLAIRIAKQLVTNRYPALVNPGCTCLHRATALLVTLGYHARKIPQRMEAL